MFSYLISILFVESGLFGPSYIGSSFPEKPNLIVLADRGNYVELKVEPTKLLSVL